MRKKILLSVMAFLVAGIVTFIAVALNSGENKAYALDNALPNWNSASIVFNPYTKTAGIAPNVGPIPAIGALLPIAPPTAAPPITNTATISITGDLMVHEWQLDDAKSKGNGAYTFDYTFEHVKDYLSKADYTIGNLETTFPGKNYSGYPMFGAPDVFAQTLKKAGFDMVSTANNHSNDKWEAGILRTLDVLDEYGLDHVGTYRNQEERDTIFIKDINGIKFAFLSYTYGTNGLPLTKGKDYLANLLDEALIKSDIAKAKTLEPDFIVVLPHMGNEYELAPKQVFKNWINMMLEAGADIVLAGHPHVLQPVEFVEITDADGTIRQCFIAYSLGNFISSQRTTPRDAGIILNLEFEKIAGEKAIIKSVAYTPTWVKFVTASGAYHITVLSVFDVINAVNSEQDVDLRQADITRIKKVHQETTKMISGWEIPLEHMQNEYVIFTYDELKERDSNK